MKDKYGHYILQCMPAETALILGPYKSRSDAAAVRTWLHNTEPTWRWCEVVGPYSVRVGNGYLATIRSRIDPATGEVRQ